MPLLEFAPTTHTVLREQTPGSGYLWLMKLNIICFLLFISSPLFSQDSFLSDYKLKWKNAAEYTMEFARAMPEDHYGFKPTDIEMTYREQLQHVATNMIWLCSSYLGGKADHVDPSKAGHSKKEVIAMLEKSFAYATETINRMTEKNLNERVDFLAGNMTKRRLLLLLTDHVTHHRGQLVVYLRLKNVEPPDYRGW
jgi:uncharacterized damage-inducible protein DinB